MNKYLGLLGLLLTVTSIKSMESLSSILIKSSDASDSNPYIEFTKSEIEQIPTLRNMIQGSDSSNTDIIELPFRHKHLLLLKKLISFSNEQSDKQKKNQSAHLYLKLLNFNTNVQLLHITNFLNVESLYSLLLPKIEKGIKTLIAFDENPDFPLLNNISIPLESSELDSFNLHCRVKTLVEHTQDAHAIISPQGKYYAYTDSSKHHETIIMDLKKGTQFKVFNPNSTINQIAFSESDTYFGSLSINKAHQYLTVWALINHATKHCFTRSWKKMHQRTFAFNTQGEDKKIVIFTPETNKLALFNLDTNEKIHTINLGTLDDDIKPTMFTKIHWIPFSQNRFLLQGDSILHISFHDTFAFWSTQVVWKNKKSEKAYAFNYTKDQIAIADNTQQSNKKSIILWNINYLGNEYKKDRIVPNPSPSIYHIVFDLKGSTLVTATKGSLNVLNSCTDSLNLTYWLPIKNITQLAIHKKGILALVNQEKLLLIPSDIYSAPYSSRPKYTFPLLYVALFSYLSISRNPSKTAVTLLEKFKETYQS